MIKISNISYETHFVQQNELPNMKDYKIVKLKKTKPFRFSFKKSISFTQKVSLL